MVVYGEDRRSERTGDGNKKNKKAKRDDGRREVAVKEEWLCSALCF